MYWNDFMVSAGSIVSLFPLMVDVYFILNYM